MEYNFIQYREESAFGLDLWGREWSSDLSPVSPFYLLKMIFTLILSLCVCWWSCVCQGCKQRTHIWSRGMACGFLGELGSSGSAAMSSLSEPSCLLFLGPSLPAHTMMCLLRRVFTSFFFPDTGHNLQLFLLCRPATVFLSKLQTRAITTRVDIAWEPQTTMMMWQSCHSARRQRGISVLLPPLQSKCAQSSPVCQSEWWPCHLATQAGPSLSFSISHQDS